eukprot:921959_1
MFGLQSTKQRIRLSVSSMPSYTCNCCLPVITALCICTCSITSFENQAAQAMFHFHIHPGSNTMQCASSDSLLNAYASQTQTFMHSARKPYVQNTETVRHILI